MPTYQRRFPFLFLLLTLNILSGQCLCSQEVQRSKPRNIVWIIPDDMSANFSCYGETAVATPNVDRLAAEGVRFTNAYVTAPVCSTCRSAFITGMYQTSIGAHHHRSGRGERKIRLPSHIELVPKLFQDAGYYTTISGWPIQKKKMGKTDYNFEWDSSIYDGNDWAGRKQGQPFFAQIQTPGGKLRGANEASWAKVASRAESEFGTRVKDSAVELPPYYPAHPAIVRDWAAYLDSVRLTDLMVGQVLQRLEDEGELQNTLVLFMTDHGISHARGKQFLYDEGIHVPLVIRGPGIEPGKVRDDVVEHIDIAALSLAAAGIATPDYMQAKDILSADYTPRTAVFSARDRCDETVDHIRSVRTKDLKYIRNFLPERPYLQPCAYKDAKEILIALREYHEQGKLDSIQASLFRTTRPAEELFDLKKDPFELNNLVDDPTYAGELLKMRELMEEWIVTSGDQGAKPENPEMYESDMAVYIETIRKRKTQEHLQVILDNINTMKTWAAEGR